MQNVFICGRCELYERAFAITKDIGTGEGVWWVAKNPLLSPSTIQKIKKDLLSGSQKKFKNKKGDFYVCIKDYFNDLYYIADVMFYMVWL